MNMPTVPSNQLKEMQQEIESLKEQVAYLEELNRKLCDKANQLTIMDARAGETIAQQAEAIRLKDAALTVAENFVDRHSEKWYASGQRDLQQIREAMRSGICSRML